MQVDLAEPPGCVRGIAERVDLADVHLGVRHEPGQVQHQIVEPRDRLPAKVGHHRHRGHVGDPDQPRHVRRSLLLHPRGGRAHEQRADSAAPHPLDDARVEAVAGHAWPARHPHRVQGHAVHAHDLTVGLGDERAAAVVGDGAGEEVPPGLDQRGARIGRRAVERLQRGTVGGKGVSERDAGRTDARGHMLATRILIFRPSATFAV